MSHSIQSFVETLFIVYILIENMENIYLASLDHQDFDINRSQFLLITQNKKYKSQIGDERVIYGVAVSDVSL